MTTKKTTPNQTLDTIIPVLHCLIHFLPLTSILSLYYINPLWSQLIKEWVQKRHIFRHRLESRWSVISNTPLSSLNSLLRSQQGCLTGSSILYLLENDNRWQANDIDIYFQSRKWLKGSDQANDIDLASEVFQELLLNDEHKIDTQIVLPKNLDYDWTSRHIDCVYKQVVKVSSNTCLIQSSNSLNMEFVVWNMEELMEDMITKIYPVYLHRAIKVTLRTHQTVDLDKINYFHPDVVALVKKCQDWVYCIDQIVDFNLFKNLYDGKKLHILYPYDLVQWSSSYCSTTISNKDQSTGQRLKRISKALEKNVMIPNLSIYSLTLDKVKFHIWCLNEVILTITVAYEDLKEILTLSGNQYKDFNKSVLIFSQECVCEEWSLFPCAQTHRTLLHRIPLERIEQVFRVNAINDVRNEETFRSKVQTCIRKSINTRFSGLFTIQSSGYHNRKKTTVEYQSHFMLLYSNQIENPLISFSIS